MIKEKLLKSILSEQRKTNEILSLLKQNGIVMTDRAWRKYVRQYNSDFHSRERYIASDNNGYYLTTNKQKIIKTARNKLKVGVSMIKNAKKDLQELSKKDQLSLMKNDVELYDLIMKMKEI